jgi:DNA-binding NarL/FixJ family response regulator
MLRRRNRPTEARELLREALDAAHVTASERRIAEHASEGLTNREIAQTLFVTARTVEGHLTSVFRKLQLDSRNELWPGLTERAPVSV